MPTRKDNTNIAPIYREQVFIPASGATLIKQKARPKINGIPIASGAVEIVSPEFDLLTGIRGIANLPKGFLKTNKLPQGENLYYRQLDKSSKGLERAKQVGVIDTKSAPPTAITLSSGKTIRIGKTFNTPFFAKGHLWYDKVDDMDVIVGKDNPLLDWKTITKGGGVTKPTPLNTRRTPFYMGESNQAPTELFELYRRYPGIGYRNVTNGFPTIPITGLNTAAEQMKCGGRRKAQLGLDIREGGIAIPIAPNMYYMNGRSHDEGGIGIGPNNKNGLEVEGGEVVKVGNKDIKVFSSVPLLRGVSPAQLVMGGANPNDVFKAQEEFKDRNRINDDGTTYENGGNKVIKYENLPSSFKGKRVNGRILQGGVPPVVSRGEFAMGNPIQRMSMWNDDLGEFSKYMARRIHKFIPKKVDKVYRHIVGYLSDKGPNNAIDNNAENLTKAVSLFNAHEYKAGGIYIKPSKRGTFTAAATKHGMGVQEFASKVLANKEDYSPAMVKKANFARNSSRWKKEYGGDGNVLPEVVVTGKKPKTFFEKLDDYADISEKALAIPNLALSGASLISPNPITIGGAYLTSASGALLDLYQGGRALYKGEWFNAGKNAIDLGLSLLGLKALRNANKLNELDKALDASGATREYVRKSVGRGRGKRKATFTKEKNEAITQEAIGYGSIPASTAFSMLDIDKNRKEYGGSMIYTINGNVKNGLTLRPKATLGTKKEDEEKKKKNPNEARYASRIKKGKAQEVTAKPVVTYNEDADKNPDKYRYTRATNFGKPNYVPAKPGNTVTNDKDEDKVKNTPWIGQYKPVRTEDWIGSGANVAGSIASYFMTKNTINKMPEPLKPVMTPAVKLKTKYNIQPQLTNISEAEQMNRASVRRNTQSSNTSLAREQRLMNEARGTKNTLYGQKENIETQLINQDKLNRQSVMRDDIRTYNEYLNRLTATKTAKNQLKVSNINNLISGLTNSVNSVLGNIESRRATNNTLRAIAAANPNVDARLIGGFDYYIDPITKRKYNKNQQYVGTING